MPRALLWRNVGMLECWNNAGLLICFSSIIPQFHSSIIQCPMGAIQSHLLRGWIFTNSLKNYFPGNCFSRPVTCNLCRRHSFSRRGSLWEGQHAACITQKKAVRKNLYVLSGNSLVIRIYYIKLLYFFKINICNFFITFGIVFFSCFLRWFRFSCSALTCFI